MNDFSLLLYIQGMKEVDVPRVIALDMAMAKFSASIEMVKIVLDNVYGTEELRKCVKSLVEMGMEKQGILMVAKNVFSESYSNLNIEQIVNREIEIKNYIASLHVIGFTKEEIAELSKGVNS